MFQFYDFDLVSFNILFLSGILYLLEHIFLYIVLNIVEKLF